MATLIQLRRGTEAEWSSANPTLAAGEVGISLDVDKIKIGDGTTAWSSLPYANLNPTEVQSAIDTAISNLVDGAPDLLNTLNELAAAINDDPTFFTTIATNLSNHESDTTNVHGIADTSLLATTTYVDNAISSFEALPDQTGNAGEFLTTDGTNTSWTVLNVEPTIHPMFIIGGV